MTALAVYEQALRDIINVLGPQPCTCEGAQVEVADALDIAHWALEEVDEMRAYVANRDPQDGPYVGYADPV